MSNSSYVYMLNGYVVVLSSSYLLMSNSSYVFMLNG